MGQLQFGRHECGAFERAISREWLVSNGIGGFACGTLSDTRTRRYHGLLTAALSPPQKRYLMVASLDVSVAYGASCYPLATHEFADGTVDPQGYLQLESFRMENGLPVWRYAFSDVLLEKRILMRPGHNTTLVNFRVLRARDRLALKVMPLCALRDFHHSSRGGRELIVEATNHGVSIMDPDNKSAATCHIHCDKASFSKEPLWYWRFKQRVETARGLDDVEDLFRPGYFDLELEMGEQATFVLSAEASSGDNARESFSMLQTKLNKHATQLQKQLDPDSPGWIKQLALAADQFIVDRHQSGKPVGKTVIAGYPWFGDWGRDTMIALSGLTLITRRYDIAASILRTFASVVDKGMLPNRFPDQLSGDSKPEYNTADASLWYFHALDQYLRHTGDLELAAELYPVLADIIEWHRSGTRFGIMADPHDCLLYAGEQGMQLTWMDAKVGDRVVTPRIGKAVEINALWYNALEIMSSLSAQLGKEESIPRYRQAAAKVKLSFQRFWNEARGCLYDVIDGPEGESGHDIYTFRHNYDDRLRPNQLLAVSLPHSPLSTAQQKSVVDICAHQLVTSHGLRSLGRDEPGYVGYYRGGSLERDNAYHQGAVWAWLIGPFVDAHYRVYQDTEMARTFLEPLGLHLSDGCVGSISEIFDAEPPFAAKGCFAQAWSVAEVLRAWFACSEQ